MPLNNVSDVTNNQSVVSTTIASSKKNSVNMQDFLMLVVAQMQNQDMNSTQDNSQFMAQMAQMASMQAMQELTAAFMSSMSVSYMGKYVKAEALTNTGERVQTEGLVERVNFNGGDTMVLVNNIWFKLQDIYELRLQNTSDSDKTEDNNEENTDTEENSVE